MWAAGAALVGAVLWALLTATLAPIADGESWNQLATLWSVRFRWGLYFGGFVGVVAAVPYTIVLGGWLAACEHWPQIEGSALKQGLACVGLSLPFTLFICVTFAGPSELQDWGRALQALPWVGISAAGGILFPRLTIRPLRRSANRAAAEPRVAAGQAAPGR